MKKIIIATLILFPFCSVALADGHEDEHGHSDVEFSYVDGAIEVELSGEGLLVFEGEFGEGEFANFASEPGFASEIEEGAGINPSNVIAFNALNNTLSTSLYYWDGTQAASPGDTTITISGVGGAADTVVSVDSGVQLHSFVTPANLLGQADDAGDFHVDPGFTISDGAAVGAYGLVMSLSTDDVGGIDDSNPIGIFLNFGLAEDAFEAGVDAFAGVVPEPSSLFLVWFGIAGISVLRHKR